MRLDDILAANTRRLSQASPSARLDARLLARHALGVGETWLIAHGRDELDAHHVAAIERLVERRAAGEPVAYILGEREFFGRTFRVTPDTLIPRPETEHVIEAALARLGDRSDARVLDIGTGSGCIAITLKLERPSWSVCAVDISERTLTVARSNGERLAADIEWLASDLFAAVAGRRFDLIVSNPPYVAEGDAHLAQGDLRFEPTTALASGTDGLDALRAIVKSAPTHLEAGSWLIVEHGWDQGDALAGLLAEEGFRECFLLRDLAGQARVSGGRLD
jgi:release factor glutamine methyltransferase